MDWKDVIQLVLGSGGLLGILLIFFRTGKVVEKIENLDKKVDDLDKKVFCIQVDLKTVEQKLSRLEGTFEERGRWESRKVQ